MNDAAKRNWMKLWMWVYDHGRLLASGPDVFVHTEGDIIIVSSTGAMDYPSFMVLDEKNMVEYLVIDKDPSNDGSNYDALEMTVAPLSRSIAFLYREHYNAALAS